MGGHPDNAPKRGRGRIRKDVATASPSGEDTGKDAPTPAASTSPSGKRPRRARTTSSPDLPPRLTTSTSLHHHNLSTFLAHAAQAKLNTNSAIYKGTHYEYICMAALADTTFNFELYRTGRANDLGVDLVGWWAVPDDHHDAGIEDKEGKEKKKKFKKLKVLAQCKSTTSPPKPSQIRELEGAYIGAPAGWNSSSSVLAFLLTTQPATKGVLAAVQRSRWPMGVLQVTREGEVRQFVWNAVAREEGLEGVGVVVRYGKETGNDGAVKRGVRLTWRGRLWRA